MKKLFSILMLLSVILISCVPPYSEKKEVKSDSGVTKATTTVETNLSGKTIEQENVIERLKEDNKPGAIKHLYILSAYSGQVLIYSTVKGKVTSSGKRLNPYNKVTKEGWSEHEFSVTRENLQDDGTYGSSVEYIYWWDSKNIYHQQYITGGMILHISNQPLAVKSVVLNMETTKSE